MSVVSVGSSDVNILHSMIQVNSYMHILNLRVNVRKVSSLKNEIK
jgi:hypothetical protein